MGASIMTENVKLTVAGMKCGGCEKTVTEALMETEGVLKVKAVHNDDHVEIEFDKNIIEEDDLIECIENAGFIVED